MRLTAVSGLVSALTIGLVLLLSQVGEGHRHHPPGCTKGKMKHEQKVYPHGVGPRKHMSYSFHGVQHSSSLIAQSPEFSPPPPPPPPPRATGTSKPSHHASHPGCTKGKMRREQKKAYSYGVGPKEHMPYLYPNPSKRPSSVYHHTSLLGKSPEMSPPSPQPPRPSNPSLRASPQGDSSPITAAAAPSLAPAAISEAPATPPVIRIPALPVPPSQPPISLPSPSPISPPSPSPSSPPSIPASIFPPTPGLQVGFYQGKCSNKTLDVEAIIARLVKAQFGTDPTILPAILRMQFHDCFVGGCDASILLNGTSTESTAGPNVSVRGYDFIEALKAAVEAECPGVVSCADIIAIATTILIKLGGGPDYPVQTGRRDGVVSNAQDALNNLPSPFLSVDDTIAVFDGKNLTIAEMVVLLGCHTVGVAHCGFYQDRLYPGTTLFDPNMDPSLRQQLIPTCPQGLITNNTAFLDQGPRSSNKVDNSFFSQILQQRGILSIDQLLAEDSQTQVFVQQLSQNATLFGIELAKAMVKMQAIDILTGTQGEIRKVCSATN